MKKPVENTADLKVGDIVVNKGSGTAYVVIATHPQVVAVRCITVSNPSEWWTLLERP